MRMKLRFHIFGDVAVQSSLHGFRVFDSFPASGLGMLSLEALPRVNSLKAPSIIGFQPEARNQYL